MNENEKIEAKEASTLEKLITHESSSTRKGSKGLTRGVMVRGSVRSTIRHRRSLGLRAHDPDGHYSPVTVHWINPNGPRSGCRDWTVNAGSGPARVRIPGPVLKCSSCFTVWLIRRRISISRGTRTNVDKNYIKKIWKEWKYHCARENKE